MPDFGIMRGFNEKLFGDKLVAGQLPTQLGLIGSSAIGLILDKFPNASAAYSVRKLRTDYTGFAMRVRRSSDNTESDIGFNGADLDTTALTSFCGSSNGFVTTWYDQSGNARNAVNTTAANQPQIVNNGLIILESTKPTLQFDGSNDTLQITNRALTGATAFSIFNVCNYKSAKQFEMLFVQSSGTSTQNMLEIRRSNLLNSIQYLPGATNAPEGSQPINNRYILNSYLANAPAMESYVNNILDVSGSNIAGNFSVPDVNSFIGSRNNTFNFDGILQELIIYRTNQTTNRTNIQIDINTYYGIY